MNLIGSLQDDDLQALRGRVRGEYDAFRMRGLKLDMTRGKPAPDQLDLASDMLAFPGNRDYLTEAGEDARNYGVLQGLPEARTLFAPMLGAPPSQICIADNSSLAVMHDCIVWALLKGVPGSVEPWGKAPSLINTSGVAPSFINTSGKAPSFIEPQGKAPAFICPVPGYDRHFALCEEYGIRMLSVPLTGNGPDMDAVEALAADPTVKGMWCVPKYSNPSGEMYSPETIRRLAAMRTGAADFRLFWDNAYAVHHLTEHRHTIENILDACSQAGHPDRAFIFASTSKITLAGAGLASLRLRPPTFPGIWPARSNGPSGRTS